MKYPKLETITKVVHELIDQYCGREGPAKDFYVPNHWSDENEFNSFTTAVNNLITQNADFKHGQTFKISGDMPEEVKKSIFEAVEMRRAEIRGGLVSKIISAPSSIISTHSPLTVMKDFDWQVKMILASNLLADINESLINLDLLLVKPTSGGALAGAISDQEETSSIEMDKSEIRLLIDKLEDLMDKLNH